MVSLHRPCTSSRCNKAFSFKKNSLQNNPCRKVFLLNYKMQYLMIQLGLGRISGGRILSGRILTFAGYPVSGYFFAGYPVSGKSAGYPVSGHSAGLSGRIFDYF